MATKGYQIQIEHVRSFAKRQTIPIKPLTLLVGENSTGKSTFLAIAACVFDPERFPTRPGFNHPPFNLGSYDTIATFKGGKYGRDEHFTIGFSVGTPGTKHHRQIKATYQREQGLPGLKEYKGESAQGSVSMHISNRQVSGKIMVDARGDYREEHFEFHNSSEAYRILAQASSLSSLLVLLAATEGGPSAHWSDQQFIVRLMDLGRSLQSPFQEVVPLAPIRTKPKRTYDELAEDYSPEGDHIPKLLARLLGEDPLSGSARRVQDALVRFGTDSGLFKQIEVKQLGRGQDAPFQVQVGVGGPRVNLVDVGYGVSQALPVIVQTEMRQDNTLMLIQQPEVHLHPRAQASLGSFFAQLVALSRNTLLVETHSDFLVDRVRQEVASGTLKAEDVTILFFHKDKAETIVYSVGIDRQGNVIDAPEHYRQFFLEEELKLLQQG